MTKPLDKPNEFIPVAGWPLYEEPREISPHKHDLAANVLRGQLQTEWPYVFHIDDYRSGGFEIHIHVRVRFEESEPEDLCAVYKRAGVPFGSKVPVSASMVISSCATLSCR